MAQMDDLQLQQQYGGQYVACRDGEVILSASTYDELSDQLEALGHEADDLLIEYVDPDSSIRVY